MRTPAIATTLSQIPPGQIRASDPLILVRRWVTGYRARRTEQMAIAQLHAMSDHLLRDIGLTRSEITGMAKYEAKSDAAYRSPVRRGSTTD